MPCSAPGEEHAGKRSPLASGSPIAAGGESHARAGGSREGANLPREAESGAAIGCRRKRGGRPGELPVRSAGQLVWMLPSHHGDARSGGSAGRRQQRRRRRRGGTEPAPQSGSGRRGGGGGRQRQPGGESGAAGSAPFCPRRLAAPRSPAPRGLRAPRRSGCGGGAALRRPRFPGGRRAGLAGRGFSAPPRRFRGRRRGAAYPRAGAAGSTWWSRYRSEAVPPAPSPEIFALKGCAALVREEAGGVFSPALVIGNRSIA